MNFIRRDGASPGPPRPGDAPSLPDARRRSLYLVAMTVGGIAAWVLVLVVLDQPPDVRAASILAGIAWTVVTAVLALRPTFVRSVGVWVTGIVALLFSYAFASALFISPASSAVRDVALTAHAVYLFAFLVLARRGGAIASGFFLGAVVVMTLLALVGGAASVSPDDTRVLLTFLGMSVLDVGALSAFAVLFERDVAARAALETLARYALIDPLTQLPNRRALEDRLAEAVARAQRHDLPFAVLFVDLDRFKQVNDTHGHAVGDALLQAVARRLEGAVRASDALARISGDEFAVIVTDPDPGHAAETVSRRVREALALPVGVGGLQLHVRASIGASVFPRDGTTPRDLLARADERMYAAKALARAERP